MTTKERIKYYLGGKIIHKTTLNPNFDGVYEWQVIPKEIEEAINASLPAKTNIIPVLETPQGTLFVFMASSSVLELTDGEGIKLHQSATAGFFANLVHRVHIVSIPEKTWRVLYNLNGWSH